MRQVGGFFCHIRKTGADAALAASLFHYRELTVGQVKEHLRQKGIPVRREEEEDESGFIFSKGGSDPAIVQEASTGQVLMLAYMNGRAWKKTLSTGYTWFYSRSRKTLWNKGASSATDKRFSGCTMTVTRTPSLR